MISFLNRKLLLFFLGSSILCLSFTQEPVKVERSSNKVVLEGKVYYIHTVAPGQTLYSISKAYNISQEEISVENPGVVSGIIVGQALKIPVEPANDDGIDTSVGGREAGRTHKVRQGETFYGISRMYGITEEALAKANPSVLQDQLRPGQRLVIPAPERKVDLQELAYNEEGFAIHRVKRRETLYSIARYYGVTEQDIRSANPELGWGMPKTDQLLRIPVSQVINQPFAGMDTTRRDSSLVAPADSVTAVYPYEELRQEVADPGHVYRIAYFIPFDFQKPEPLDSLLKDVKSVTRRNKIIEGYLLEQKVPQSVPFLEFFQGSLLALDSMRKAGMKLDIRIFDTHRSMDRVRDLLMDKELQKTDLIIGPFYPYHIEIVAEYAKENRIPMVAPFYSEHTYIIDNPYLFQPTPSIGWGYREVAKLVASKHTHNIVYVREEDSLDIEQHSLLKELINDGFDDYRPTEPVIFKELVLTLEHTDEIIQSLSRDRRNLVVVATRNEALASRVVSSLYYQLKDFQIEVIGTTFWTEFSSIDYRYYHDLSLFFYSSFWMDYNEPELEKFLAKFRNNYYTEPRAMTRTGINYGIAGYDMTLYFTNALRLFGRRFILSLDEYRPGMILEPYQFSRVTSSGGFENSRVVFYQFLPDMTIREFMVPDLPDRENFFKPLEEQRRTYLNNDTIK
jgi:LysM repeat protein